jgi:hypothetical protein
VLNAAFKQAERACKKIERITTRVGRANLDTELGAEAADFLAKYDLIKALANNHPDCTAPDLPS